MSKMGWNLHPQCEVFDPPARTDVRQADIMVVDDHPPNVLLLEEMLGRRGHRVRSFLCGPDALAAAIEQSPDLVLLDINMPGWNGYEVCARLKAEPGLAQVPVIFLSALSQTGDKVRGFRAGGVDYISKPFEFEEVQARVETHLRLHGLEKSLRNQNSFLDAVVQARTRELREAHRRLSLLDQAKSEFLRMISHELRTPLNGLFGTAELLLSSQDPGASDPEIGEIFLQSKRRILGIVDSALLLTQIGVGGGTVDFDPLPLGDVLQEALDMSRDLADSHQVRLERPQPSPALLRGGRELLIKGFCALLETAVKYSKPGDTILVEAQPHPSGVIVSITTSSGQVPASVLGKFFDLFSVNESNSGAGDLGLAPGVACRILSLFGASVTVANLQPAGIQLQVRCPPAGTSETP